METKNFCRATALLLLGAGGPLPLALAAVTRVFGGTADDTHAGDSGDSLKINIYTGVLCAVGGALVLLFVGRTVAALTARKRPAHIMPSERDSPGAAERGDDDAELGRAGLGHELRATAYVAPFDGGGGESKHGESPVRAKRKVKIRIGKNNALTHSVV